MTANLRIFVSTLLLHFDVLIELAVWGAKIVISLHFSIILQSVSAACVRWGRSSSVWTDKLSHGIISTPKLARRGVAKSVDSQSPNKSEIEWHVGCQRPSLAPPRFLNMLNKGPIECSSVSAELRPRVPPALVLSSPAKGVAGRLSARAGRGKVS